MTWDIVSGVVYRNSDKTCHLKDQTVALTGNPDINTFLAEACGMKIRPLQSYNFSL